MLSAKTRQDFKTLASQGTNFGNGIVMNDEEATAVWLSKGRDGRWRSLNHQKGGQKSLT